MIIRNYPFPIIKIGENVYKFLPPDLLKSETDFLRLNKYLSIYNQKTKFNKFKIPKIRKYFLFTKTKYMGDTIFASEKGLSKLYNCISDFSNIFKEENDSTISLGDIQIRNVYFKEDLFYLLDLGRGAGEKVSYLYNQSRFLVHLIDCNLELQTIKILKKEKNKKFILKAMNQRSIKVFKKRLLSGNFKSAFFRMILYIKFNFKVNYFFIY
tara:strand:+ start:3451 stop:4083 length:633 start_codon:yes stop_codon:yes gene_type:complete